MVGRLTGASDSANGRRRLDTAIVWHYAAAALRSAGRSRFHAAVCLAGLIVGITSALLIAIYIVDELSYDRWIPGHEQIVQLAMGGRGQPTTGAAPSDLGHWVRSDFPDIGVARLFKENVTLERNGEQFAEVVTWADASFFDVLPLPVIAGDAAAALARPDGIVLTRDLAQKLFGTIDVLGELVNVNARPMTVTAVLENLPSNTHLDIDVLAPSHAPFSSAAEQDRNPLEYYTGKAWLAATYARLPSNLAVPELRRALPAMLDRRTAPGSARRVSERFELTVRPIAHIHLSSGLPDSTGIDARPIYVLAAVAALIVIAASINFVNLMTARAATRAVEVGVRKSLGASRRDLVVQYMMEAWLYVALATVVSLALIAAFLLPLLNAFLLRSIELGGLLDPVVVSGLVLFVVSVGLLAGTYPSLVLSRFPAVTVMRARTLRGGGFVRETLIVTQFAILIALLVGTAVISRQMTFAIAEALGQYTNPIVTITTSCSAALKTELRAVPEVEAVACAGQLPQWGIGTATPMQRRDGEYRGGIWYTSVDFGFFELYGMKLVAGRFFVEDLGSDAAPADNEWRVPEAVVLNESAVKLLELGSPAEAVGAVVAWSRLFRSPSTFTPRHDAEVIGVVQDFQTGRLTESGMRPTAFYVDPGQAAVLSAKLSGRDLTATLAAIREVWQRFGDPRPIQLGFFDATIELMYRDLIRQQRVFAIFASVAVFISFLGLLGLLVHTAERRTKEVAVRRILGGTRLDITALLVWQFARPVLCAIAIAWPLAYVATGAWLEGFARRIELDAMSFLLPAAATLLFALVIVVVHAAVVLRRRPVSALRYE
jgi:putative ABC transport system permease protein